MIIINNEEALRIPCQKVTKEEIPELILALEQELKHSADLGNPGVGLAAPQIGIGKRIAIVRYKNLNLNLINCKIDQFYDPINFAHEGCLSFPGRIEKTLRYQEIVISNNEDFPNKFIMTGLGAIICQHEVDHFNSILFIDKICPKISVRNKVGPNDPCICGKIDEKIGKIKKYKKCCGV